MAKLRYPSFILHPVTGKSVVKRPATEPPGDPDQISDAPPYLVMIPDHLLSEVGHRKNARTVATIAQQKISQSRTNYLYDSDIDVLDRPRHPGLCLPVVRDSAKGSTFSISLFCVSFSGCLVHAPPAS